MVLTPHVEAAHNLSKHCTISCTTVGQTAAAAPAAVKAAEQPETQCDPSAFYTPVELLDLPWKYMLPRLLQCKENTAWRGHAKPAQ